MSPTTTLGVAVARSSTMDVPVSWFEVERTQMIMASIRLGIEQAKRGEGRILTDADLETDDDDE